MPSRSVQTALHHTQYLAKATEMLLVGLAMAHEQPYTTWSDYGGSADSMQYSALRQINRENVNRLEPARFYSVPGPSGRFGFNP
jgi:quinoprotein glucose dehydrogenase